MAKPSFTALRDAGNIAGLNGVIPDECDRLEARGNFKIKFPELLVPRHSNSINNLRFRRPDATEDLLS